MASGLVDDRPVQVVPWREGSGRPRLRRAERGQVDRRAVNLTICFRQIRGGTCYGTS